MLVFTDTPCQSNLIQTANYYKAAHFCLDPEDGQALPFVRVRELQEIYITLRKNAGGRMKPDFPVFKYPELWVQRRLQERDDE